MAAVDLLNSFKQFVPPPQQKENKSTLSPSGSGPGHWQTAAVRSTMSSKGGQDATRNDEPQSTFGGAQKRARWFPPSASQDNPHNAKISPTTNKEQHSDAGNHGGGSAITRGPHSTTTDPKAHGQHKSPSATGTAAGMLHTGRQSTT